MFVCVEMSQTAYPALTATGKAMKLAMECRRAMHSNDEWIPVASLLKVCGFSVAVSSPDRCNWQKRSTTDCRSNQRENRTHTQAKSGRITAEGRSQYLSNGGMRGRNLGGPMFGQFWNGFFSASDSRAAV